MALPSVSYGFLVALCVASALTVSCSRDDSDSAESDAGRGGAAAGAAARGGAEADGGRNTAQGGGGRSSAAGSSGARNDGGRLNAGGSPGTAGSADAAAGDASVPEPGSDGASPYIRECHGDSLDCEDPALRCLGIRDGSEVFGYGCSNVCETVADCSSADSRAPAKVGCVDFVTSKHCLLVCKDELTGEHACPTGMSCYVYPGSLLGYCLWRD